MGESLKKENEFYVYLEFNDKVDPEIFKNPDLFFKIVNLHKKKPLVQLGSHLYEGTYEDTVGTKVFFKETECDEETSEFAKQTPLKLEYCTKAMKCLRLNHLRVPDEITQVDTTEVATLNLQKDYKETLKKYKENTLDIKDVLVSENTVEKPETPLVENEIFQPVQFEESEEPSTSSNNQQETEDASDKVEKLLEEAINIPKKPTRRTEKISESKQIDPAKAKNILVLKQLYLQNLTLKDIYTKVDVEHILDYIDIEKSVQEGVIGNRDFYTNPPNEDEKATLVSMENFHNLCVPLQLTFLIEQLRLEKEKLNLMNDDEREVIDDYGRTPKDRYRLLKTFAKDIWYLLFVRLSNC